MLLCRNQLPRLLPAGPYLAWPPGPGRGTAPPSACTGPAQPGEGEEPRALRFSWLPRSMCKRKQTVPPGALHKTLQSWQAVRPHMSRAHLQGVRPCKPAHTSPPGTPHPRASPPPSPASAAAWPAQSCPPGAGQRSGSSATGSAATWRQRRWPMRGRRSIEASAVASAHLGAGSTRLQHPRLTHVSLHQKLHSRVARQGASTPPHIRLTSGSSSATVSPRTVERSATFSDSLRLR